MDITIERLRQLSETNARARVMINQWYPEISDSKNTIESNPSITLIDTNLSSNNQWEGAGWYYGTFREGTKMLAYKTHQHQVSGIGFYSGTFGTDGWYYSTVRNFVKASDEYVKSQIIKVFKDGGFTSENTVPVDGVGEDERLMDSNIDNWCFVDRYYNMGFDLYSMPLGHGGMLMYRNGQFASKRNVF
jgi:hypothetical protein